MLHTLTGGSYSEVIYVVIAPSGFSHLLLSASEISNHRAYRTIFPKRDTQEFDHLREDMLSV